ncbi:MAG: DUF692 domain-containing protein [Polyangiaceae bacterium]|nr:DUF692 domain-containing protein [Polyangiaceae bacterium]
MKPGEARGVRGVGLGLRWPLLDDLLEAPPAGLGWLEIAPENYMRRGGRFADGLARCRERWPLVTHGLCLSLGGFDPLDGAYLRELRAFLESVETPWHSDHLCFGAVDGVALHDLLPLPFHEASVQRVVERVRRAQDALGVPLAVENVSAYAQMPGSIMSEADFVAEVVERAGCGLLLDVNNIFVNSLNHGFDPREALGRFPLGRVVQMHVAGHERVGDRWVDTHGAPVRGEVLELLGLALAATGPVPVLLERDDNFPAWAELCAEFARIVDVYDRATARPLASRAATAPVTGAGVGAAGS